MCSMQLMKAQRQMARDPALAKRSLEIVEAKSNGTRSAEPDPGLRARGARRLKAAVKEPLEDLPAACYYGCLLTRPPEVVEFDDCEQPVSMEAVLTALGAKPVDWNYKTECCGAGMTLASEETVLDLSHKILANAAEHGANCLAVACPMCHVNLDMKQAAIERQVRSQARDGRLLPVRPGRTGAGT